MGGPATVFLSTWQLQSQQHGQHDRRCQQDQKDQRDRHNQRHRPILRSNRTEESNRTLQIAFQIANSKSAATTGAVARAACARKGENATRKCARTQVHVLLCTLALSCLLIAFPFILAPINPCPVHGGGGGVICWPPCGFYPKSVIFWIYVVHSTDLEVVESGGGEEGFRGT